MPGPKRELCSDCYFFRWDDDSLTENYPRGNCYRYPPSQVMDDEQSEILVQPVVHSTSWCGEFKLST